MNLKKRADAVAMVALTLPAKPTTADVLLALSRAYDFGVTDGIIEECDRLAEDAPRVHVGIGRVIEKPEGAA